MKKKALFALSPDACDQIYGPEQRAQLQALVDLSDPVCPVERLTEEGSGLETAQILFSGWGAPVLDRAFLDRAPALEAVFYGAGSIRSIVTEDFWAREIPMTSSYAANAVPVAEFAEAQIVLALKQTLRQVMDLRAQRRWLRPTEAVRGAFGATVGLVSLGMIGQMVARRLQTHDVKVLAYDPTFDQAQADQRDLGVRLVSLEALFECSDVVSLHAPNLPETRGMIRRDLLQRLKSHATLINTARGAILDEPALCDVLAERPDLFAVLDVTFPEPPRENSPLFTLSNVALTPHIAGSMGDECHRMGQIVVEECRRFLSGKPLEWRITREMAQRMA